MRKASDLWIYLLFALLSFLFLLVFSSQTSPLFNTFGGDSAVFILLGKLFLAGKIPYVDFFDHKGPVLILLQSLGLTLWWDERTGVFILQIINLFAVQFLIFKIGRLFLSKTSSLSVVLMSLLIFSFTIQGGNMTEEFSLPYLLFVLLFTALFYKSPLSPFRRRHLIGIGISLAVLFWMRPNNAGVICACLLFVLAVLIKNKSRKRVGDIFFYGLIGFLALTIPLIVYFIKVGALTEMLYANFIFNLKYAQFDIDNSDWGLKEVVLYVVKAWISLLVLIVGSLLYYKKTRDNKILFLSFLLFLFGFATTHIGAKYAHYMTLNLPAFVLGFTLILSVIPCSRFANRFSAFVALLLLVGYGVFKYNDKQYQADQNDLVFISQSLDIASKIPESERSQVFAYNVHTRFWLIADILPSYKFFTKQEWHGLHDSKLWGEMNRAIRVRFPLWIVLPNLGEDYMPVNKGFYDLVNKEYSFYYKNEGLMLYKKNLTVE